MVSSDRLLRRRQRKGTPSLLGLRKRNKKFYLLPTSLVIIGQYCLPFDFEVKNTYGARRPLFRFRKDYQCGFRVWCRKYSGEGDEDEDFTFPSPPSFSGTPTPLCKKEEGTSPEEGGSPSWKEEGEDTCEIKNDSSTPEGDKAGHELSFNGWLSSLGGPSSEVEGSPSSSLKRKEEEEGISEAPGTSKASISPKKSQSPFSDSQMKELIEKLNRHREATPPRQVGGNRPPIPEPSSIHTAGTSSRAQPVRDNQPPVPEPSKNSSWWESLLCLCRGSKAKENTPSGNEGNGQDTGSGENDPGAGE